MSPQTGFESWLSHVINFRQVRWLFVQLLFICIEHQTTIVRFTFSFKMSFPTFSREMSALTLRKRSMDGTTDPRRYLRRFPSDSDLYRKVLHKKAMSHTNLHKKFASCTQLNKASSPQHHNCKVFKYDEKLTRELNKFYSLQVRENRVQVKRNKRLAFSVVFKVLINAQVVSDRFTIGEILRNGARYGDLVEKESDRFEFGVPFYFDDGASLFIHRAEEDGFVRLQLDDCKTWEDCLDPDGFLSGSLVRSKLQLTMNNALRSLNNNIEQGIDGFPCDVVKVDLFCEGSTIVLQINSGFLVVELIPTIAIPKSNLEWCRRFSKSEPPSHVVGKACQFPLSDPETLWELSFLSAENRKLRSLGTTKYRLLLSLAEIRERDKMLCELSLYQLQTVLFHTGDQINDPMKWNTEKLGERFLDILRCLEKFLENKYCPHFFIPNANLFSAINAVTLSTLKDRVRRMVKPTCVACGVATMCKNREQRGEIQA